MLSRLIRLARPFRYAWDRASYRRDADTAALQALKGRYRGKAMLVVGNGPSLNQTPLDDFAGIPAIGMNKIDLIYRRTKWRPTLVVCVNDIVVMQHVASFVESEVPVYLSWKSRRFVPARQRGSVNFFLSLIDDAFSADVVSGVGASPTVTYTALQFAHYMEADPVIIFGVDHSFQASGPANAIAVRKGDDVNHFDPHYFKAGSVWGVPDLDGSERVYHLAKQAFDEAGRTVVDATIGGKLDVFPKVSLDEARALAGVPR
jgi:hypothetical protein